MRLLGLRFGNRAAQASGQPLAPARTVAEIEGLFARLVPRTSWRIVARNTARTLFDGVREVEQRPLSGAGSAQAQLVRESVGRAVDAAGYRPAGLLAKLIDWASGSGIETAWSAIHDADQRLLMIETSDEVRARLDEIVAALRNELKADDPRLADGIAMLTRLEKVGDPGLDRCRSEVRRLLQTAHSAGDEAHRNVRSFRNLLILLGTGVAIALAAVAVLHALVPSFLSLAGPSPPKRTAAVQAWEAEVAGMIGGLVAALFTITRLGGFSGAYRLPAYQALIRIPAGALIGLVATILLQSNLIDALRSQYGMSLLAYALLFGYAPEP